MEATFLPVRGFAFPMNVRPIWVTLLLASVALAGCAADGPGSGGTTTTAPTGATTTTAPTTPADRTPTIDQILVGTDAAYPPFEDTVNGSIVGFDIEVMEEVASRAGFTVTFQNAVFDTIIPSVQTGQFRAGMSAFSITDERKLQVDFSVPYYDNQLMAAVANGTTGIDDAADLEGKKVCTQRGTTSEFYLREELGFTDEDLLLLDTAPPCRDALLRGDVQALLIDAAFVRALIEASEGDLDQAFTVDPEEQFGIVVKKGDTELLVAINTALTEMKADGSLQQLVDKWQV